MGKVIVYGAQPSVCTRRVLLVLKEKNIEYEFVPVNLAKGEQKVSRHIQTFYGHPRLIPGM